MPRKAGPAGSPARKAGSDSRRGSTGGTGTLSSRRGHSCLNMATLSCDAKWILVPGGVQSPGGAFHGLVRSFLAQYKWIPSGGITLVQADLWALEEAYGWSLDTTSVHGFLPRSLIPMSPNSLFLITFILPPSYSFQSPCACVLHLLTLGTTTL